MNYSDNSGRKELIFIVGLFVFILALLAILVVRFISGGTATAPLQYGQYNETARDYYTQQPDEPTTQEQSIIPEITKVLPSNETWSQQLVHTHRDSLHDILGIVSRGEWIYYATEAFVLAASHDESLYRLAIERLHNTGEVQPVVLLTNLPGWPRGFGITPDGNFRILIAQDLWDDDYFLEGEILVVAEYDRHGQQLSKQEFPNIDWGDYGFPWIEQAFFMNCGGIAIYTYGIDFDTQLIHIIDPQGNRSNTIRMRQGQIIQTRDGSVLLLEEYDNWQAAAEERLTHMRFDAFVNTDIPSMINVDVISAGPYSYFDMYINFVFPVGGIQAGLYGFCITTNQLTMIIDGDSGIHWRFSTQISTFTDGRIAAFAHSDAGLATDISILSPDSLPPLAPINNQPPQWRESDPRAVLTLGHTIDGAMEHNGNIYYWYTTTDWANREIIIHQLDQSGTKTHTTSIEMNHDNWFWLGDITFTTDGNILVLIWIRDFSRNVTMQLSEFDKNGNHIAHHNHRVFEDVLGPSISAITPDGGVVAIFHEIESNNLKIINPGGEIVGTQEVDWGILHQTADGRFVIEDTEGPREINLQTGQLSNELTTEHPSTQSWEDWETAGFELFNIQFYVNLPDNRIAIFYRVDLGTYSGTALIFTESTIATTA